MGRVSRSPKNKYLGKQITKTFWFALSWLSRRGEVEDFMGEFLTSEERLMLAKRLAVLYLLYRGFHYRQIAHVLGMSTTTVNLWRHQYILKKQVFLPLLKELDKHDLFAEKEEKEDGEFWSFISDILSAKTDMRARARLYQRAIS